MEAKAPGTVLPFAAVDLEDAENGVAEPNRQTSEFATYKYYFTSIGWLRTTLFAGLVVLYGVSFGLTGVLLTQWTSAVEIHGNKVNGYYLGIYGLLTGLGTLGLLGSAW